MLRHVLVIQVRKHREVDPSQRTIAAGGRVMVLRDTISSVVNDVPAAANDSVPEKRAAKP